MYYHTVKEMSDRIGAANIHKVTQHSKSVSIQMRGGLIARKCGHCASGEHVGASVRPRITFRSY